MNSLKNCVVLVLLIGLSSQCRSRQTRCASTPTTASGRYAASGQLCSGQLIFEENFNELRRDLWGHEITLGGGGNWEFQWYVSDPHNSYVRNGKLHIRPSLTVDTIGEHELENGLVKLDPCTNAEFYGCERQGTRDHIINPIRSARVNTAKGFSFKYGKLEIVAKLPTGDWLWPALWLLPTKQKYGGWPRSGEIDLMESRGNRNYTNSEGKQIGVEHFGSTLHFGPSWDQNGYSTTLMNKNTPSNQGFNKGFHRYEMDWTPEFMKFSVDGHEVGTINVGGGFWARGGFQGENIWKNGARMAPFDDEFHIVMNLAVGGTNGYFPDVGNQTPKPWLNSSPRAAADFWKDRSQWLNGWNLNRRSGYEASFVIDSVKVWAL